MLTVVYAALILCSSGSLSLLIRASPSLFDDDAYRRVIRNWTCDSDGGWGVVVITIGEGTGRGWVRLGWGKKKHRWFFLVMCRCISMHRLCVDDAEAGWRQGGDAVEVYMDMGFVETS